MKSTKLIYLLAAVLLVNGCSQISTTSEKDQAADLSILKTYAWGDNAININRTGETVDRIINNITVMVRDNIQPIVDKHLAQKGYTRIKEGEPDFIVQYSATGNVQKARQGNMPAPVASERQSELMRSGVIVIGNLTISLLQPGTNKVLWRGQGETLVKGDGSTTTRLKKVVAKIFQEFPIN